MQTQANAYIRARRALGSLTVAVVSVLATALLAALAWGQLRSLGRGGEPSPAEALTAALTVIAAALAAWFVVGLLLEMLSAVPGRVGRLAQAASDRFTPALARRVAALTLGTVLTGATLPGSAVAAAGAPGSQVAASAVSAVPAPGFAPMPASGAPAAGPGAAPNPAFGPADAGADHAAPSPVPDPAFTPTRPRVRNQPAAALLSPQGVQPPAGIVVHRGDTLWSIAARALGPGATDAQIARAWPQWYAANRDVIGDDPDLIRPGQVLRPPAVVAR